MPRTNDQVPAACLYDVAGLSQEKVSRRMGLSRIKVVRLRADARGYGPIRNTPEPVTTNTLDLAARFGLNAGPVAPMPVGLTDPEVARRVVGIVAAGFPARIGRDDAEVTIGVGCGRTMAARVKALTGLQNRNLRCVSLIGGDVAIGRYRPVRCQDPAGGADPGVGPDSAPAPGPRDHRRGPRGRSCHHLSGRMHARAADSYQRHPDHGRGPGAVARRHVGYIDLNRRAPSIEVEGLRRTDVTRRAPAKPGPRGPCGDPGVNRRIVDRALARALPDRSQRT